MRYINLLYHNSSSSIGGIQQTMKMLKEIQLNHLIIREFNFSGNAKIEKGEFSDSFFSMKVFKVLPRKLSFFIKLLFYRLKFKNNASELFVIFNPIWLLAIPFNSSSKNILLVQTNRFDKFFSKFTLKILALYSDQIIRLVTYTKDDSLEFERKLSCLRGEYIQYDNIPRGCKLETANSSPNFSHKLLFVGRISEVSKNLSGLIKVFEMLPEYYELTIVGDGEQKEVDWLRRLIKSNGRVKYLGPITSNTSIKKLYQSHSLFLMTSHYEGFGNTLIEARSQGLPIVAFNTFVALKSIVVNGVTGYIVEPYDYVDFTSKVSSILNDESVYRSFSESSLLKAEETEKHKIMKLWVNLITGLIYND